jgi:hypothetical protein
MQYVFTFFRINPHEFHALLHSADIEKMFENILLVLVCKPK